MEKTILQIKRRHFLQSPGFNHSMECPAALALTELFASKDLDDVTVGTRSASIWFKLKSNIRFSIWPAYQKYNYEDDMIKVRASSENEEVIRELTLYKEEVMYF